MDWLKKMFALGLFVGAVSLTGGMVGCDDGNNDIEDALDNAGDNIEDAADNTADGIEDAADDAGDAID